MHQSALVFTHVLLILNAGNRTLSECFQLFDVIHQVTTEHATVTRITREVVEDLAADNVIYAELRTTPKVISMPAALSWDTTTSFSMLMPTRWYHPS